MDKKLIVIKVGTSSLTSADGAADGEKIKKICEGVADLRDDGYRVIVVSSGAIAAGFRRLGFSARPKQLAFEQASAAVGQMLLMDEYSAYLGGRGYQAAQILLTPDAFLVKEKYINAFNTMEILLKRGAVPIINENNTVTTSEIRFGDNDTLSAQVAAMVHADRLVLLTDVDGLYTGHPKLDPQARRIEVVEKITPEIEAYAEGAGSANGTGGMKTKISAARLATSAGVEVYICSSLPEGSVAGGVTGENPGTLFKAGENLKTRLQWMAFYAKSRGEIIIDQGAADAVGQHHKSLLLAGITAVHGDFAEGDVVDILTDDEIRVARGFASYGAEEIRAFMKEGSAAKPIVHIDNMVVSTEQ
ncbi:MAG: glutamate 5-kinase [Clostridiales bacterium]|nr:glutamate 5-kinase [Clostridiales bacterium]